MIEIHLGVVDTEPRLGAEIIRKPQDYISARLAIRDALQSKQDLHVYVETRVCDEWFWDLESYPGVRLLQEDPVVLLCRKLHVPALPSKIVDPVAISSLRLLELPAPSDAVGDVSAWIAGHKLGKVWADTQPSYGHLTDLLTWLADNSVPEVLHAVAELRMELWINHSGGQLREAYHAIRQSPQKVTMFLCCWKALKKYDDETRARWLEEEKWYLADLQWLAEKLGDLPLPNIADKILSPKAEAYWHRRLTEFDQEAVR